MLKILEQDGLLWLQDDDKYFLMEPYKLFDFVVSEPVYYPVSVFNGEPPKGKFIPLHESNYVNAGFAPNIRLVSKNSKAQFVNFHEMEETNEPTKKKLKESEPSKPKKKKNPNLVITIDDDDDDDEEPEKLTAITNPHTFWGDDEKTIEYLGPLSPKTTQAVHLDEDYLELLDLKPVTLTRQTATGGSI